MVTDITTNCELLKDTEDMIYTIKDLADLFNIEDNDCKNSDWRSLN